MRNRSLKAMLVGTTITGSALLGSMVSAQEAARPNVVIMYFDDMGYSDVGFNDISQPSLTPRLDKLASEGMTFTRGYSASAVCTPSRYGLLTGRYPWRTSIKSSVIGAYDAPIFDTDRFTIASLFKTQGYNTAAVGKWHLGMQFHNPEGDPVSLGRNSNVLGNDVNSTADDLIDFSHPLSAGPFSIGFDYFWGTGASPGTPPYAWIENDRVLYQGAIATEEGVDFDQARPATNADFLEGAHPEGLPSSGAGAYDPTFVIADYLEIQTARAVEIISENAANDDPFFLYVPFASPHLPWGVQDQFDGVAGYTYGDYLAQGDYYAGLILDALADPDGDPETDDGIDENTIVIMSSDNGPEERAQSNSVDAGRDSNGPFRGVKRESWDGGVHVPFTVRWPEHIAPGSVSNQAVSQLDILATLADVVGYQLREGEAEDSESFLALMEGFDRQSERRTGFITHSSAGQFGMIDATGEWKYIDGTAGAGDRRSSWDSENNTIQNVNGTIGGNPRQLFNLLDDPGETNNLMLSGSADALTRGAEMYDQLTAIRGNTTDGAEGESFVPSSDPDGDGILSFFEEAYPSLNPNNAADARGDTDNDGLTNLEEFRVRTDPGNPDTDGDGIFDGAEVAAGTNPAERALLMVNYTAGDDAMSVFDSASGFANVSSLVIGDGLTGGGRDSFVNNRQQKPDGFGNTVYNFGDVTAQNLSGARRENDAVSFSISSEGQNVVYDQLSFYSNQFGTDARISVTMIVSGIERTILEDYVPASSNSVLRLETVDLHNLTTAEDVTFKFYLYGASSARFATRLDDIAVLGRATDTLAEFVASGGNGDFDTPAFDSDVSVAGVSTSSLRQGGGLTGGGANAFVSETARLTGSSSGVPVYNLGDVTTESWEAARRAGDFILFTVSPEEGNRVVHEGITFYANQVGADGKIAVTYTVETGTSVERIALEDFTPTPSNGPLAPVAVEFPKFATARDVTWRIYFYGSQASNFGTRIDDLEVLGSVLTSN